MYLKWQQHCLIAHSLVPCSGIEGDRLGRVEHAIGPIGHCILVVYRVWGECKEPIFHPRT